MTVTLRDRAEHAAKYQKHLVVPAVELKQLLDQLDEARATKNLHKERQETEIGRAAAAHAALDAVRELLATADRHQNAFIQTGHLRNALTALEGR